MLPGHSKTCVVYSALKLLQNLFFFFSFWFNKLSQILSQSSQTGLLFFTVIAEFWLFLPAQIQNTDRRMIDHDLESDVQCSSNFILSFPSVTNGQSDKCKDCAAGHCATHCYVLLLRWGCDKDKGEDNHSEISLPNSWVPSLKICLVPFWQQVKRWVQVREVQSQESQKEDPRVGQHLWQQKTSCYQLCRHSAQNG